MSPHTLPGSHNRKVDLHVHTPQSHDYKDSHATADDLVNAAIAAGLDAIAVTDHNDYRFIDLVKEAAHDKPLIVFPGVELSTRDGHIIALLDPRMGESDVHTLLIACGLTKDEEYGKQDSMCKGTIEEVARKIVEAEGVAIAAHVDRPKGFLETVGVGQARKRIIEDRNIMGLELFDGSTKDDWQEGRIYPQARACVQGSDSHSLDTIGSRFTWVRVADLTIAGLRQALKDPKTRIRFSQEFDPDAGRDFIESLYMSQGFFSKQTVFFNPGLNCIIGGQGVGKSALIEFIRFVLDCTSKVDPITQDHVGKLKTLLGYGGSITLVFQKADKTRYSITRVYDGEDNPATIKKLFSDGSETDYSLPDLPRYFQILAYSQNEALSVARDSVRQLDLIDAHIDLTSERNKLKDLEAQLDANTAQLIQLAGQSVDLEYLESRRIKLGQQISEEEKELRSHEEAENNPVIRDHQAWLDEERFLNSLRDAREKIKEGLMESLGTVDTTALDVGLPSSKLGHDAELKRVWDVNQGFKSYFKGLNQEIEDAFKNIRQESQNAAPNWIAEYREHVREYKELSEKLGNVQINTLQANLQKNKSALESLRNQIRAETQRRKKESDLLQARNQIMNQVESERQRMSQKRDRHAQTMSKTLNKRVQVSVTPGGNRGVYIKWLSTHLDKRSIKANQIEEIVREYSPRQLAELVRNTDGGNAEPLASKLHVSVAAASSILSTLKGNLQLWYGIEHIRIEDLPDIRMRLSGSEYRQLDELSTGQKFTVIILLALTDDDKPIVYDQPEDSLEAALRFSDIAQLLRQTKDSRQFIFATHDPNLSVAADLDLAIVVSGSAKDASVEVSGGLEDPRIRNSLIVHLEGGKEAMDHRIGKYES